MLKVFEDEKAKLCAFLGGTLANNMLLIWTNWTG